MDYQIDQAVEILRRTPATLTALLRGLPEEWTKSTAGPDTWSAYDVVGHLLHAEETDWIPRARIILEEGESHPFDSFDRTAMFEKYQGYSLDQLLDALRAGARTEPGDAGRMAYHAGAVAAQGNASGAGNCDVEPVAGDLGGS